ncbi:hypothetical protein OIO90_002438 [Microbotryomycetes sp. JL221]|nr:hypothetical protein OIO90_002438 [Microbotryomycetes sp. JL221]
MDMTTVVALKSEHVLQSAAVMALAFLLSTICYIVWSALLHPLRSLPGPLQAKLGLGWMSTRALKEDFGWKLAAEHAKHGTIVRIGRNTVSISDPNAIQQLYKHTGGWAKGKFYSFFSSVPGSLMSTLDHHEHRTKRTAQSAAFAMNYLVKLESFVDQCLDDLVALLSRQVNKGNGKATIEMAETLQLLALDVVGELAFGESFHLCETGRDVHGYLQMFHGYTVTACLCGTAATWLAPITKRIAQWRWGPVGAAALGQRARQCVQQRVKQMQDEKKQGDEERQDILAKLFAAKNPDGSLFKIHQVSAAAGSILGAGSDTTAITLRAVMKYVLEDARIYEKVISEIETAVDEGRLQFPITYGQGVHLEYFQACLKETLRLHAAVPWTLPRVVPDGGVEIVGRWFPAGTEVAMSPYVVHRTTEAYGPDAHIFRPERWLEADVETKKEYERNLLTFGTGSRVCIGKNISLMEITKVVPTLLYKFKFNFTPRSPSSPHKLPGTRPSSEAGAQRLAAVATTPKTDSPLKQVNVSTAGPPRPKLWSTWDLLTSDSGLFKTKTQAQTYRFFAELFCLTPSLKCIEQSLDKLDVAQLSGPFKSNMSALFVNAVKMIKEASSQDSRKSNVVNTLIPFMRNILSRNFSNYSFEVMTMLAGSLDRTDAVFADLVSAIDSTIGDTVAPLTLRHRTLQLALVIVASLNQSSVTAYFLRRDMFSTLVKFMSDDESAPYVYESSLLLGLLANFRKFEARNPYGVRIEDFVEDLVMVRIIDVVRTVCQRSRDTYIEVSDDTTPSFVASLTSLVMSFRLSELLSSFTLSLPPPPPPRTPITSPRLGNGTFEQGKQTCSEGLAADTENSNIKMHKDLPAPPSQQSKSIANGAGKTKGPVHPSTLSNNKTAAITEKQQQQQQATKEESQFGSLPPEILVILLPFYDLLNLNKAFSALLYNEADDGPPTLPPAIISLASYVVCHAAVSTRAQAYSRLCLMILMILVEEGEGKLTDPTASPVRLCRQRQPMLPHNNNHRPVIAAMLDTTVIFLRHNLRKKLDVETYIVCLKLVQRLMQQLKTERVRLDYDWVIVWRSVLGLAGFIVSNVDDLRTTSTQVDSLISQIFIILCYAAYWGEQFLPDSRASALLYYELLHADSTLEALARLVGAGSLSPNGAASPVMTANSRPPFGSNHPRDSISGSSLSANWNKVSNLGSLLSPKADTRTPTSPELNGSLNGRAPASTAFLATECIFNIRSILEHLKPQIHTIADVSPEDLLRVIERHVGAIELVESSLMMDMRRGESSGSGSTSDQYFTSLVSVACGDTLRLIPLGA